MSLRRGAVKALAAAVDAVRRPATGLVVLIYHRVGQQAPIEVDLTLGLFEDQMAFLAEKTRVVSLDEGLRAITSAPDDPGPLVSITFDDGTRDFVDFALPVLERNNLPATVYVATQFLEEQRPFPHDGEPLSWDALRHALETGLVTVGSHTHRHALFDRVSPTEATDEIDRSMGLIQDRLGVEAAHFAYPKALLGTSETEALVRARFRSAAIGGGRANRYGFTDPHRLARSPVQTSDGMRWFARKVRGGLAFEESVRRAVNRSRYRGATS